MSLDEMEINQVIDLRNKKNSLIKDGDMTELIKLKMLYPDLFDEGKDKEIQELIDFCEYFSNTSYFKYTVREEKKRKLIAIDFDTWERGMLDDALKPLTIIKHENIHAIARLLVKESLVIVFDQCNIQEKEKICAVLPFMGILVNEILSQFHPERPRGHLSRALFKLRSAALNNEEIDDFPIQHTVSNASDETVVNQLKKVFQDLLKKILFKFNKRIEHYHDLLFFLLMEVSDFIGLLANKCEDKHVIIKQIENKIAIAND